MAGRPVTYIYGSEARQLDTLPVRREHEERVTRPERRRNPQPKQRIDKVAVLLVCLTFVAVMVVGISYIHLQFKATYLDKSVVKLQDEVIELEKKNATAMMDLENSVNLKEVYERATKDLGMKVAKNNQVYTYESKKSTQIRQHGSIPSN